VSAFDQNPKAVSGKPEAAFFMDEGKRKVVEGVLSLVTGDFSTLQPRHARSQAPVNPC